MVWHNLDIAVCDALFARVRLLRGRWSYGGYLNVDWPADWNCLMQLMFRCWWAMFSRRKSFCVYLMKEFARWLK